MKESKKGGMTKRMNIEMLFGKIVNRHRHNMDCRCGRTNNPCKYRITDADSQKEAEQKIKKFYALKA